jgi:hypothetical protein
MDEKPEPPKLGQTTPDDVTPDASPNAPRTHNEAKALHRKPESSLPGK